MKKLFGLFLASGILSLCLSIRLLGIRHERRTDKANVYCIHSCIEYKCVARVAKKAHNREVRRECERRVWVKDRETGQETKSERGKRTRESVREILLDWDFDCFRFEAKKFPACGVWRIKTTFQIDIVDYEKDEWNFPRRHCCNFRVIWTSESSYRIYDIDVAIFDTDLGKWFHHWITYRRHSVNNAIP